MRSTNYKQCTLVKLFIGTDYNAHNAIDGFGLLCLMPLSTIFQIYHGVPGENHRLVASH